MLALAARDRVRRERAAGHYDAATCALGDHDRVHLANGGMMRQGL